MGRSAFKTAILGGAACLVLGTGVMSALLDFEESLGNHVDSGEFDEGGGGGTHDLKVAVVPWNPPGGCDGAVPAEGPIATVTFATVEMTPGAFTGMPDENFCLYNEGDFSGVLDVYLGNAVDTELGCTGLEATVDTCTAGAPGELSALFGDADIAVTMEGTGDCVSWQGTFQELLTGFAPVGSVDPGEYCEVFLEIILQDVTDDELRIAQSDRVQFDIGFSLSDAGL